MGWWWWWGGVGRGVGEGEGRVGGWGGGWGGVGQPPTPTPHPNPTLSSPQTAQNRPNRPNSFVMEFDIHTALDALTLVATGMVIYAMVGHPEMRVTYQKEQDVIKFAFVVRAAGGWNQHFVFQRGWNSSVAGA